MHCESEVSISHRVSQRWNAFERTFDGFSNMDRFVDVRFDDGVGLYVSGSLVAVNLVLL